MGLCSYCNEQDKESYWSYYCRDCAMLRRMLVLHEPKKCIEILKRCLIRNETQINNKINVELKSKKKAPVADDSVDYDNKEKVYSLRSIKK